MKARFFALAALVLGMVSCQQDFDAAPQVGGEVDFQLKVDAVELATRAGDTDRKAWDSAYGAIDYLQGLAEGSDEFRVDWNEVDLRYSLEVYDADVDYASAEVFPVKDRQVIIVDQYEAVKFDLRLVPNRNYRFVVFADFVPEDASNNPAISVQRDLGKYHVIGNDLRDITIKNDAINAECTDAYFASEIIRIENSAAKDIVLTRPYGKVRVIATDLAELNINVDPAYVKVFYTAKHPQAFNAVTGTINTYEENVEYEFLSKYAEEVSKSSLANHYYIAGYDNKKATNVNGVERHTHMTLFTDYILAADEQEAIHFSMEVYDKKGGLIKQTYFNTDIPVKRNNLTTIVGNVLTTATEINVTINDNFANYIEKPVVFVSTAKELQKALNDYVDGQTILFDGDIEGNVTIDQAGKNYVVCGNGYKFDGTITIDGNSNVTDAETVRIENVNFESADAIDFIEMNSTDGAVRYAHNVTIENCTFKGGENAVGMRFRQCFNIVVKNCEVISGHSLAQLYGCTGVTIEGTKVNADRGVSFGASTNCVVKDSEFNVKSYGLRVDADGARTLTVENSTIKAFLPVVARKATANYTINFGEGNVLEAPGYDVVFTTGDDEATFVAPAEYTITGADNFKVFPRDNYNFVYTADDLKAAVAAGGDYLLMPTTIEGRFDLKKPVILKGVDGATIKGRVNVYEGADSEFKNIKFAVNSTDSTVKKQPFTGAPYQYPAIVNVQHAATTFEGCYFETSYAAAVCGINYGNARAYNPLTVNNCKFEGGFYPIRTRVAFNITNCEFVSTYNGDGLCAVWTWGLGGDATTAIFSNNKGVSSYEFNGVQVTAANYAYSNTTFTVENNNGFDTEFVTNSARDYSNSTLNGAAIAVNTNALKAAVSEAGATVNVMAGEYTFPSSVAEGVTIVCEEGTVFTGNSKLNIKGATVVGATFSNPSGTAVDQTINGKFENCTFTGSNALRYCYAGETCEFEGCEFDGGVYGVHFDGGANNVTFRNCTISGFNAFAAAIPMVTFDGCTFQSGLSGYNGANLWGSATLNECEFKFDGSVSNEWIDCIKADGQYSFTNCTVNGAAYTSDNYTSFPDIFSRNDATVKINGVDCAL